VNSRVDPAANVEQVREWHRAAVFGLNDNGWLRVRENAVEAWSGSYHSTAAFINWSATLSAEWRAALGPAVERPREAQGPAMRAFVHMHEHLLGLGAVERDVEAEEAHPIVIKCIFLSSEGINASIQRFSPEVPCRIHPRGVLPLRRES
jgi:hypothetical protein